MPDIISETVIKNIRQTEGKRYSLPNVKLSDIEIEVLKGLAQGRSIKEITFGLKLFNKHYTFYSVSKIILEKLEAFTLPHAIYKALQMKLFDL